MGLVETLGGPLGLDAPADRCRGGWDRGGGACGGLAGWLRKAVGVGEPVWGFSGLGLVETFGGRLPGGLGPLWGRGFGLEGWLAAAGGRGWLADAGFSGSGLVETLGGTLPGGLGPLWGRDVDLEGWPARGLAGWAWGRLLAGRWGSMPRRAAAGWAGGGRR